MKSAEKCVLYVYWLRAPMLDNQLVYVGCSHDPEARRLHAQKRYNMILRARKSKAYSICSLAKLRETAEIEKHWPTIFDLSRKSDVPAAYSETIKRMKIAAKRRGVSPAALAAATKANTGRKLSAVARRHLSESLKGLPSKLKGTKFTPEHCAKIGDANRRRVWRPETRAIAGIAARAALALKYKDPKWVAEQNECARVGRLRHVEDKRLLNSGWGYPWRLASLDTQTRSLVEGLI